MQNQSGHRSLLLRYIDPIQKKIIDTPIVKHPTATQGLNLSPVAWSRIQFELV